MTTITINQNSNFERAIKVEYIDQWDLPDSAIKKLAKYEETSSQLYKAFYIPETEKLIFITENDLNFFYGTNIKDFIEGKILQVS